MSIRFIAQLQLRILGDGTNDSLSFSVIGKQVAGLGLVPTNIDKQNLPVAVFDARIDEVEGSATASLDKDILSITFTPAPVDRHSLVVRLIFNSP